MASCFPNDENKAKTDAAYRQAFKEHQERVNKEKQKLMDNIDILLKHREEIGPLTFKEGEPIPHFYKQQRPRPKLCPFCCIL